MALLCPFKIEPKFGSSLPYGFQANNLQRIPINIPSIFIIYSSLFAVRAIYITRGLLPKD